LIGTIVLGIVWAVVGGWLIVVAVIGAIIVLFVYRAVVGRRGPPEGSFPPPTSHPWPIANGVERDAKVEIKKATRKTQRASSDAGPSTRRAFVGADSADLAILPVPFVTPGVSTRLQQLCPVR